MADKARYDGTNWVRPPKGHGNAIVGTAIVVVVAALLALTGTLDVPHAVLLAGLALAAVWAGAALGVTVSTSWPAEHASYVKAGVRTDVARLGWRLRTRDGSVDARAIARVRDIAAVRLAARGVRWANLMAGDPAAVDAATGLVGPATVAGLRRTRDLAGARVRIGELSRWLVALDRLGPADAGLPADAAPTERPQAPVGFATVAGAAHVVHNQPSTSLDKEERR